MEDVLLTRRAAALGGALGLATVLADPALTRAAAAELDVVNLRTPSGRTVSAALAEPAAEVAPGVILIHEWWGLNDQIKAYARELALAGYRTLAVDLMGAPPASTPEEAQKLVDAVRPEDATEALSAWIAWLSNRKGSTGKVATLGFCFGGGWSLNASLATPMDATVIYYGRVDKSASELAALKGPVLGHFARHDNFITEAMVRSFEKAMAEAGKSLTVHWYEAEHGFANPTGARYDAEDAKLAQSRTLAFLKNNLG